MLERIAQRQRGAERLAAKQPAVRGELGADLLERSDERIGMIERGIVGGGRAAVPPELDHHGTRDARQRGEVRAPERAAREDAVDQQQKRSLALVDFVMEPRSAHRSTHDIHVRA